MLPSVGVTVRLSTGDSRVETGDEGSICSCCRASNGNFRVSERGGSGSASSGIYGLDERPGKADRGGRDVGVGVGVESALVLYATDW